MRRGESSIKNIQLHLANQDWEQIINICQQEISNDPNAIDFYPYLARAYTILGKLEQAIGAYKKILGTPFDQAEIYAELGLLYSKQKNSQQAAWNYEQALIFKPNWPELKYNLAVVLHQSGDWQGAITAYNQALEIKPDYTAAHFNLGVLHDQKGELELAIASYQGAIAVDPKFTRAYSNLGSTFARQKNYDLAIATFLKGLHLDPTWPTLHNNLGQIYWFNQQQGKAYESFTTAVTLDAKMSIAHHNLGKLWQQQGNYTQASNCFQNVMKLEPQNVLALSHYADVQLQIGDLETTLNCWRKIIELEPQFVDAYCQRILATEPEDVLEIAKVACARFLQALRLDRKTEAYHHLWRAYYLMGDVLFEFGGLQQAEFYYQRALQIRSSEAELYLKLGNCLAKQKKLNAAVVVYQIGLTIEPKYPQICFQLGRILERSQDAAKAVNYYEAVLNQKIDSAPDWKNLPSLFTSEDKSSFLPQKIYHHAQDWARDCKLENFNYVQVLWGEKKPTLAKIAGIRQPELIKTNVPGQISYAECGGVNCNSCMTELIQTFQPQQIGKDAYRCSFDQASPIQTKLPFVISIPDGRGWIAPHKNSWIICNALAVITSDNYLLGDLSRDYPWFLPTCPYQERPEHQIFQQDSIATPEKIEGKVALLSGLAGHVYYHWMFDVIPRLELIRLSGIELETIDWFVVNSLSKPFQRETLQILGIPEAKIIESDRHSHIEATELIVPSFPGYMDWVPEGTMEFLRQTFIPKINLAQPSRGQKIYVSRVKSKNRQLVNEAEVSELLHREGFKSIFLEEMSVLEQVAAFVNAEVIVASHGSGLTNLVFCSPDTKVIELFSPNYLRTDYWMISQQLKLEHYYLIGKSFNCPSLRSLMYQNPLTEDILVNVDSLNQILKFI